MGTMPFHLEKGVLGLRMDYLTRSQKVRNHVVQRLMAGEDPFTVAGDINIPGVPTINVFLDKKADFVAKLDALLAADPTPANANERRSGYEYWVDQDQNLREANNDNTGNRNAFAGYWLPKKNLVRDQLRKVLIDALQSGKDHIDYWWECSLPDGADPQVILVETLGAAHVFFVTDHDPVEPPTTGVRGAPDPEPAFP